MKFGVEEQTSLDLYCQIVIMMLKTGISKFRIRFNFLNNKYVSGSKSYLGSKAVELSPATALNSNLLIENARLFRRTIDGFVNQNSDSCQTIFHSFSFWTTGFSI